MKKGEIINGYRILRDATTAGGGLSRWSFATKGGSEFFIKEFLSPKYPTADAPGSEEIKSVKRAKCDIFELHHRGIMERLAGKCAEGGNLIVTRDFFRAGTKYYKITDKVDVASLKVTDIAALPPSKRILILRTVAHSLRILHQAGIVHGDLKPYNILIKETVSDNYTAKLIDFDNSYLVGHPPLNREEVVGDIVYYSPELASYIGGLETVKAEELGTSADIFALGLIYHQYWVGTLPEYDTDKYNYPYAAVAAGESLRLHPDLGERLAAILSSMMVLDPAIRPSIESVFVWLKDKELIPHEPDVPPTLRPMTREGSKEDERLLTAEPPRLTMPVLRSAHRPTEITPPSEAGAEAVEPSLSSTEPRPTLKGSLLGKAKITDLPSSHPITPPPSPSHGEEPRLDIDAPEGASSPPPPSGRADEPSSLKGTLLKKKK